MLPFMFAAILGAIFHPLFKRLNKIIETSSLAAFVTILFPITFIAIFFVTVVPILSTQMELLYHFLKQKRHLIAGLPGRLPLDVIDKTTLDSLLTNLTNSVHIILSSVVSSGSSAINFMTMSILIPFLSFYFVRDQEKIHDFIIKFLPKEYKKKTEEVLGSISELMHVYFVKQVLVCLIMGCLYVIAFSIIDLDHAIVLGIFTGFLTFIPYIGAAFSCVICCIITFLQFLTLSSVINTVLIYIILQTLESNVIVMKVIGEKVGIHPVFIIFSMLLGADLIGLSGCILAIPLTIVVKVIIDSYVKGN